MKTAQPIRHFDEYNRPLEREINAYFREAIYGPLLATVREFGVRPKASDQGRTNALPKEGAIESALASGRIWYADGLFYGQFNARVVRELRVAGASYNGSRKGYSLPLAEMPYALRGALSQSASASKELHAEIIRQLNAMAENIPQAATGIPYESLSGSLLKALGRQFDATTEKYAEIPNGELLNPPMREGITDGYTTNLELSIKDFAAEQIPVLRAEVEKNAFAGARTDRLARVIESRFGVAQRKAAFLADQETGLLTAQYRQQRYEQVGVTRYVWSTSHDERVRPDHAALEGMQFSFDDPPITNRSTGARNNPGEDYRCRCVPRPILPGQSNPNVRHKPSASRVLTA